MLTDVVINDKQIKLNKDLIQEEGIGKLRISLPTNEKGNYEYYGNVGTKHPDGSIRNYPFKNSFYVK